MKLTKESLKQIIKEELEAVMSEQNDWYSKLQAKEKRQARADAKGSEAYRKAQQQSRIDYNTYFVGSDIRAKKKKNDIYKRNKDEIYDLVVGRIANWDRVKSTLGEENVTKDMAHDLINKAIDRAGFVKVGDVNVTYLNALIPRAAREEIDDLTKRLDGPRLEKAVNKMLKGEDNQMIANHVFDYIAPVVSSYLDETRGFMQKAGSFFKGKGFREE